jgi:hypothetical protein
LPQTQHDGKSVLRAAVKRWDMEHMDTPSKTVVLLFKSWTLGSRKDAAFSKTDSSRARLGLTQERVASFIVKQSTGNRERAIKGADNARY